MDLYFEKVISLKTALESLRIEKIDLAVFPDIESRDFDEFSDV